MSSYQFMRIADGRFVTDLAAELDGQLQATRLALAPFGTVTVTEDPVRICHWNAYDDTPAHDQLRVTFTLTKTSRAVTWDTIFRAINDAVPRHAPRYMRL